MKNAKEFFKNLESKIQNSYLEGTSIDEAEKLAAEFLHAQMAVSAELSKLDLDARMRKTGVKAIRATAYNAIVQGSEKKPTENAIESLMNADEVLMKEQDGFDTSEAQRDEYQRYYQIFREAHIYYRGIGKGKFD